MSKTYGIIINTDRYAGNFERELCAWCTGCLGDCEVGKEMVDSHIKELFEPIIGSYYDDNGTCRPVDIFDDEDGYSSLIIYFNEKPTLEQFNLIKERCNSFNEEYIKRNSFYKDSPNSWKFINIKSIRLVSKEKSKFKTENYG